MFEMCRMLLSSLARLRLHPGTIFFFWTPSYYGFQKLSGEAEISSLLFQILLMKRLLKRFFPGERKNLTSFGGKLFRASHSWAIEKKIRQARKLLKQEFRQVVCHPDWSNCSELSFKVTRAFTIQFVIYCSPRHRRMLIAKFYGLFVLHYKPHSLHVPLDKNIIKIYTKSHFFSGVLCVGVVKALSMCVLRGVTRGFYIFPDQTWEFGWRPFMIYYWCHH